MADLGARRWAVRAVVEVEAVDLTVSPSHLRRDLQVIADPQTIPAVHTGPPGTATPNIASKPASASRTGANPKITNTTSTKVRTISTIPALLLGDAAPLFPLVAARVRAAASPSRRRKLLRQRRR